MTPNLAVLPSDLKSGSNSRNTISYGNIMKFVNETTECLYQTSLLIVESDIVLKSQKTCMHFNFDCCSDFIQLTLPKDIFPSLRTSCVRYLYCFLECIDGAAISFLYRFRMGSRLLVLFPSLSRCQLFRTTMGRTSILSSSPRSLSKLVPTLSILQTFLSLDFLLRSRTTAPMIPSPSPKTPPKPLQSVLSPWVPRFPSFLTDRVHQPVSHQCEPVDPRRSLVASSLLHFISGLSARRSRCRRLH